MKGWVWLRHIHKLRYRTKGAFTPFTIQFFFTVEKEIVSEMAGLRLT